MLELEVDHQTSDREVIGVSPTRVLLHSNLGQVVQTLVFLLPSSISWYQCKDWEGNGRLWKRSGVPSITLPA